MRILTDRDPEALAVLRHSTAHVMAQAVLHLWPDAKIAIGPAIADGFYYDFEFPRADRRPTTSSGSRPRCARSCKHRGRVRARGRRRQGELVERFRAEHQPYKLELVEGLPDGDISLYRNDDFEDLCRGPHLQTTEPIKAFKLLSQAGAYWRGDSSKPMLTRIYGTAFFKQADLDEHLRLLEEARRRDHRRIGRELDLFHTSDVAPGAPFWHPRGMVIWNELTRLWRELNLERGYREVRTPIIYSVDIWRRSGHWDKYRDNMFFTHKDERQLGVKPMNCPGHIEIYQAAKRSYRDLPMRLAEQGLVHRDEPSGALHGLLRVIHITQDDAHIFCTDDQIEDEVIGCLELARHIYGIFDLPCGSSSRPGPTTGSATTPCGTGPRRRSRARSRGRAWSTS